MPFFKFNKQQIKLKLEELPLSDKSEERFITTIYSKNIINIPSLLLISSHMNIANASSSYFGIGTSVQAAQQYFLSAADISIHFGKDLPYLNVAAGYVLAQETNTNDSGVFNIGLGIDGFDLHNSNKTSAKVETGLETQIQNNFAGYASILVTSRPKDSWEFGAGIIGKIDKSRSYPVLKASITYFPK